MISTSRLTGAVSCLLFGLLSGRAASADSFAGNFTFDGETVTVPVVVTQSSNIVAYTDSYAQGGFVPVLALFDPSGNVVAVDGGDASCSSGRMKDGGTGICNDAYLSASATSGTYSLVLSQFFNYPAGNNLSDGYTETGNFTAGVCGTSGNFWETDLSPCVARTSDYSVHFSATATPEPATALLSLPVLALAAYRFRKAAKKNVAASI